MFCRKLFFFVSFFLVFCFAGGVFAAQSTQDAPVSVSEKRKALKKVRTGTVRPSEEEYVIGSGDLLAVSIYGEGDMSVNGVVGSSSGQKVMAPNAILVRSDGRISLRDIGDVEVIGLTFPQLADYLKQLYSALYDDPIIVTSLIQSNSRRYTVMGEVNKPGTYRLDNTTNLVQVVAEAGGFTKWAGKEITVVRKNLRRRDRKIFHNNTITLDYDRFISGKDIEKNISVRAGDIIVVK